jgi:hypothetical protein
VGSLDQHESVLRCNCPGSGLEKGGRSDGEGGGGNCRRGDGDGEVDRETETGSDVSYPRGVRFAREERNFS